MMGLSYHVGFWLIQSSGTRNVYSTYRHKISGLVVSLAVVEAVPFTNPLSVHYYSMY